MMPCARSRRGPGPVSRCTRCSGHWRCVTRMRLSAGARWRFRMTWCPDRGGDRHCGPHGQAERRLHQEAHAASRAHPQQGCVRMGRGGPRGACREAAEAGGTAPGDADCRAAGAGRGTHRGKHKLNQVCSPCSPVRKDVGNRKMIIKSTLFPKFPLFPSKTYSPRQNSGRGWRIGLPFGWGLAALR